MKSENDMYVQILKQNRELEPKGINDEEGFSFYITVFTTDMKL